MGRTAENGMRYIEALAEMRADVPGGNQVRCGLALAMGFLMGAGLPESAAALKHTMDTHPDLADMQFLALFPTYESEVG